MSCDLSDDQIMCRLEKKRPREEASRRTWDSSRCGYHVLNCDIEISLTRSG